MRRQLLRLLLHSLWKESSQAEIWSQAEQDLLTAASLLPVKDDVIGKPTKGAAYAVLGKIYVYEDFDKAIEILEPLTKSPYTYRLVGFCMEF